MPPEERGSHMVARSEETPSVLSSGESVGTKLLRIAEKARTEPGFKFTSLYHLMNEELLRGCFKRLRKEAVAGIDEVTKEMYAENLEANLSNLTERLQRMAYIPQTCPAQIYTEAGQHQTTTPGDNMLRGQTCPGRIGSNTGGGIRTGFHR
jgi:hypothetical protein